jgi:two-component system nitrate/nitrite sensor histidine kinase NarX
MRNRFQRGETENLGENFDAIYGSLTEAYQDARQSIDGLRISPDGDDLDGWLYQTIQEFEEISGTSVVAHIDMDQKLPPEVHAQLVRILQEALSNIRKHAKAGQVGVDCHEIDGDLVMEIRDDGLGFLPEDIAASARYGLRGMRERSDLLGADFQVISQPNRGTTIRVRLPLRDVEEYLL